MPTALFFFLLLSTFTSSRNRTFLSRSRAAQCRKGFAAFGAFSIPCAIQCAIVQRDTTHTQSHTCMAQFQNLIFTPLSLSLSLFRHFSSKRDCIVKTFAHFQPEFFGHSVHWVWVFCCSLHVLLTYATFH